MDVEAMEQLAPARQIQLHSPQKGRREIYPGMHRGSKGG